MQIYKFVKIQFKKYILLFLFLQIFNHLAKNLSWFNILGVCESRKTLDNDFIDISNFKSYAGSKIV